MYKSMLPGRSRHIKGQADHVDAWLMSYADLITLLFMLFVILISISVQRQNQISGTHHGEPEHPAGLHKSGTLELGTPFDEAYRTLVGTVMSHDADQYVSLQKTGRGVSVDISAPRLFEDGSAVLSPQQLTFLRALAKTLKEHSAEHDAIEVEGHTDGGRGNDWSLAALRAASIVELFQDEGLDPASLRATSYAGARPLVPNFDASGKPIADNQARNQRIIIRLEQE